LSRVRAVLTNDLYGKKVCMFFSRLTETLYINYTLKQGHCQAIAAKDLASGWSLVAQIHQ
jgi:hypothetical protein